MALITSTASTDWTNFDVTASLMSGVLGYTDVTNNRGGSYVYIDGDDDLHILSDDSAESSVDIDVSVPQDFTFEYDFKPTQLPPDLSSLNTNRCYFAVYNQQDDTLGLLFSQSGLAWVAKVSGITTVTPVPGSSSIVTEGNWYTVRTFLFGSTNVMYIYITPRDTISTTGHILRYTTGTLSTVPPQADAIRIEGYGTVADPTEFKIETLRFSNKTTELIPNKPPVADPGDDTTVLSGNYAKLDGRDSYDPEGTDLTYKWVMTRAPSESQYLSSGLKGYTPSEVDPDVVTDEFNDVDGFADLPLLQAGDLLIASGISVEIDSSSFDANGDLVLDTQLKLVTASLPENQSNLSWEIVHQAAIGDQTASLTYAHTDVAGVYKFSLTVNDGDLDSLSAELLIQALASNLKQAEIPDLSYIWKVIGDEWDFVTDKNKVETAWEAMSLVSAGYLYWLWQINACKSLATIPDKLARKWAPFRTRVEKDQWGDVTWNDLYPTIYGADLTSGANVTGKTLIFTLDGEDYTVTFSGGDPVCRSDKWGFACRIGEPGYLPGFKGGAVLQNKFIRYGQCRTWIFHDFGHLQRFTGNRGLGKGSYRPR
jgi:hypothetical protein